MSVVELRAAVEAVRERIERARERAGRAERVELVAVTKGHGDDVVDAALAAGLTRLGENRVQELAEKRARLDSLGRGTEVEWHLIGHLQRNKVKQVDPFVLVHSLDSSRLADALDEHGVRTDRVIDVLLQVNASGEGTKGGFPPAEVLAEAERLTMRAGLRVRGVMTMAPFDAEERVLRATFAAARECLRTVREAGHPADELSMGMSGDYEVAVEEGATIVRLGTILFGARA